MLSSRPFTSSTTELIVERAFRVPPPADLLDENASKKSICSKNTKTFGADLRSRPT
jgi:hypothetical protein